MLLSWFQQIDAANSPEQVVAVTRDYLATWTPDELGLMPAQCRPGRVKDAQDIEELHVNLVEEYGRNRLSGDALASLQRMTSFIVRASVRIAQLRNDDDIPDHRDDDKPRSARQRSAAQRER
jgi:hypothetical protein